MLKNKIIQKNLQQIITNDNPVIDVFILLGDLNNNIISSSITIITNKLKILNFSKSTITKVKLITIELLENITKHQIENHSELPYFELSINDSSLRLTTGNCISKADFKELKGKLDNYQNLTLKKVNEKYFEILGNGSLDDQGNAGLGLLTLMKRSKKNYEYQAHEITKKEYFFNSVVSIDYNSSQINSPKI